MDVLGFALAVLLIELTPGPNMAWLAGLAATEGRRSGLSAVSGVAVGLLANGTLAAFGLAAVIGAAPQVWNGLRFAGAAMMAWLAIEAWRGGGGRQPEGWAKQAFATGMLINLLNPKAYIFFIVVVPEFMRGADLNVRNALLLSVISAAIATTIHLGIVMAGSRAHEWISDPTRTRTMRRLFAAMMLGVAISFLVADFG